MINIIDEYKKVLLSIVKNNFDEGFSSKVEETEPIDNIIEKTQGDLELFKIMKEVEEGVRLGKEGAEAGAEGAIAGAEGAERGEKGAEAGRKGAEEGRLAVEEAKRVIDSINEA